MEIRKVKIEYDLYTLNKWFKGHGLPNHPENWFSDDGFIIPGIAAIFLYISQNSDRAYMDDMICNPEFSDIEVRTKALDMLAAAVEKEAKYLGMRYLISPIYQKRQFERAERLGNWKTDNNDYKIMVKEL